jgi:hypothetical protein
VRDLIELRAYPVHPLGIVGEATWGDPLASVVPISATRSARESPDRADGDSGQHVHRVLSNEVTPEPLHFGEAGGGKLHAPTTHPFASSTAVHGGIKTTMCSRADVL